ncbi:DUF4381 domain-containing protein [Acuticoccus sp. I52.16.1]|uniref:DUF4381 domain-containing protein n=1 Tax=Acuticoccus sp. I52.16.1 TaxID=2928472 RepID=UPI001FD2D0F5|nr:DUF4381 domain-containing protein [Acuticoccus sp. I52.16.1]UOM33487.1 DUF4381 domain-containing protein [Acuticoccus sp. I52.16.1]
MNEETATAPPSLVDLLDQLVEPQPPAPVSMMPETAGWAVLAALVLVAAAFGAWRWWRHWRADAYRRAALAELAAAGDDAARIATVLRRTALAAWPRERVAALSGEAWLAFLDETGGDGGFGGGPGRALIAAPYRGDGGASPEVAALAARWVRRHRVREAAA